MHFAECDLVAEVLFSMFEPQDEEFFDSYEQDLGQEESTEPADVSARAFQRRARWVTIVILLLGATYIGCTSIYNKVVMPQPVELHFTSP